MTLHYLRKDELALLLRVPTTLKQAKGIKARNEALLRRCEEKSDERVTLPCPHCSWNLMTEAFNCYNCAYRRLANGKSNPCCGLVFAGTPGGNLVSQLWLSAKYAFLQRPRFVNDDLWNFLRAHVEWAEVLIALGGTCTKSWRSMNGKAQAAWRAPKLAAVIETLKLTFSE